MEDNNKERRELLMIKQNPETYKEENVFRAAKEKYMKPITSLDNFFYYAKWLLLIGAIVAALIVFLVIQTTSRESEDLRIALVSYDHPLAEYSDTLKAALEELCPDYNRDGGIYVTLREIDLTDRDNLSQYSMSESEKLASEMRRGTVQMVISDEEFYDYANTGSDPGQNVFVDMSEEFPEESLYKGCGIRVSAVLPENITQELPDNLIIYLRAALPKSNNSEKAAQYRDEALKVIRSLPGNKRQS